MSIVRSVEENRTEVYQVTAGLIYAVFFHDFGEKDHVFMPVRIHFCLQWTLADLDAAETMDAEAEGIIFLSFSR